jgi:hypothetical protein
MVPSPLPSATKTEPELGVPSSTVKASSPSTVVSPLTVTAIVSVSPLVPAKLRVPAVAT